MGNPEYGLELHPIDFAVFRQALITPGPAVIEALIDPYEAPMPGHITTTQAWHFVEAMLRGEKDRWNIFKTVVENKIRQGF